MHVWLANENLAQQAGDKVLHFDDVTLLDYFDYHLPGDQKNLILEH